MTNKAQTEQLARLFQHYGCNTIKMASRKAADERKYSFFDFNREQPTLEDPLIAIQLYGSVVVLDCDTQEAEALMIRHFGGMPETLTASTPHGTHYYYLWPFDLVKSKSLLGLFTTGLPVIKQGSNYIRNEGFTRGVDLLTDGIVFTAPTANYEFRNPGCDLAPMPFDMASYFSDIYQSLRPRTTVRVNPINWDDVIGYGRRTRTIAEAVQTPAVPAAPVPPVRWLRYDQYYTDPAPQPLEQANPANVAVAHFDAAQDRGYVPVMFADDVPVEDAPADPFPVRQFGALHLDALAMGDPEGLY